MGRRLDDLGAAVALPALGHFRNRQCAADKTGGGAMVSAVAVRTMARRQLAVNLLHRFQPKRALLPCREPRRRRRIDLIWYLVAKVKNKALENTPEGTRSQTD